VGRRGARRPRRHARNAGAGDRRLFHRTPRRWWPARLARESCRCRTTWDSADACKPATSWPSSWDMQYVIRVDGDGQHDARDIPRVFDALAHLGLRDGDRIALHRRKRRPLRPRAATGHTLLSHGAASHLGTARPRSDFRFRGSEPQRFAGFQQKLSRWNIRRSKRWWCCSANDSASWRSLAACTRAPPAAPRSRPAIDLLHRARAARSIRECAQIRPAGAASR
jgi:hypothetical protein